MRVIETKVLDEQFLSPKRLEDDMSSEPSSHEVNFLQSMIIETKLDKQITFFESQVEPNSSSISR